MEIFLILSTIGVVVYLLYSRSSKRSALRQSLRFNLNQKAGMMNHAWTMMLAKLNAHTECERLCKEIVAGRKKNLPEDISNIWDYLDQGARDYNSMVDSYAFTLNEPAPTVDNSIGARAWSQIQSCAEDD